MDLSRLIKESKKGSAAAQKCLFDRYAGGMLTICCRYVRNREDAEEIMLNGFLMFFKGLDKFHYINDLATTAWLKKIMVNECLMHLRKQKPFLVTAEPETLEMAQLPDIPDNISADEILQLVMQLPAGYRTVFNLYEIEGFDHRQISGLLDITEGTSRSQLSKARQMLQKMIIKKDNNYARRISQ
jgi:RNA polymerase sigma-70 factor (ECF subfamily)